MSDEGYLEQIEIPAWYVTQHPRSGFAASLFGVMRLQAHGDPDDNNTTFIASLHTIDETIQVKRLSSIAVAKLVAENLALDRLRLAVQAYETLTGKRITDLPTTHIPTEEDAHGDV